MSELKNRITEAVKAAMRAGDKPRLGTLRLVTAAIKQREVDERRELSDDDIIATLSKMIKQRRESIAQYEQANRTDLVDQEKAEIAIIEEFLPQPLSDAEIDRLIDDAIAQAGATSVKDMGTGMGIIRPQVQGRADVAVVSARVKERLSAS